MRTWMTCKTDLFRGKEQVENFRRMAMIHPCRRIVRAPDPKPLAAAAQSLSLPRTFDAQGKTLDTVSFLEEVRTTGLMVLYKGKRVFENYWLGNHPDTQTISFSMAKSFVSTLVAFALRDGHIKSLEEHVDHYAPELANSGYAGVALRDVLQMSSGVRWNEDYSDPNSDVARFAMAFEDAGSFDAVVASLPRVMDPGTFNRYNSCDTHVLGMVLARATDMAVSEYLEQTLWHPLGMEDDCFFLVDGKGVEASAMGMNATLRDYSKLGLMFLRKGQVGSLMLLPDGWYQGCSTASQPHLKPGHRKSASYPYGYGYQWWLPDESGAFAAIGVYYQFIWVDPVNEVVIAKTTADPLFGQDNRQMAEVENKHFALFHAIAKAARDLG